MATYDEALFGVVQRKYFGLTKKLGGDAATGFTFGTTDATTQTHMTRWYPKGPIRIIKFGAMWLATKASGSAEKILAKLIGRGASASRMATVDLCSTSGAIAPFVFASIDRSNRTDFTIEKLNAGEYITIKTATPSTDKGTAANTATTTGTVAFFIDYVPSFDPVKWEDRL